MFRKERERSGNDVRRRDVTRSAPAESALLASVPALRSALSGGARVSGRLSFTEPTRIDGQLRGEIRATHLVVIGEKAVVEGTVRAVELVVLGEVRGEVCGAQRVEIGPSGRLTGTIEAHSLVVKPGGCLDSECRIAPPRAALRVLRPASA